MKPLPDDCSPLASEDEGDDSEAYVELELPRRPLNRVFP